MHAEDRAEYMEMNEMCMYHQTLPISHMYWLVYMYVSYTCIIHVLQVLVCIQWHWGVRVKEVHVWQLVVYTVSRDQLVFCKYSNFNSSCTT